MGLTVYESYYNMHVWVYIHVHVYTCVCVMYVGRYVSINVCNVCMHVMCVCNICVYAMYVCDVCLSVV